MNDTQERFETCTGYCNGAFHTTSCEAARGKLKPTKQSKSVKYGKVVEMMMPFMYAAVGRDPSRDDETVLLHTIDQFYALAVEASFLTTASPQIKAAIAEARAKIAESRATRSEIARAAAVTSS